MQAHRSRRQQLEKENEVLKRRLDECETFTVQVSRAHGFRWRWTIRGARWLRLAADRLREEWGLEAADIAAELDKLAEAQPDDGG